MKHKLHLLIGSPIAITEHVYRLLARLAVRGPVRWLMCGTYVDLQQLSYGVVHQAESSYADILQKNIVISRAETCYQAVALLRKTESAETPTFVTDLLLHFYDEQVSVDEAAELLGDSIQALKRLSQRGPVIITSTDNSQRPQFYTSLIQSADRIVRLQEVPNMGHNTGSMTMRVRSERDYFIGFCRALLSKSERLLFADMWNSVEAYIPAAEKSSHPLLIATIQMAMMLDLKKENVALKCQIEMLKRELETQHQTQSNERTQAKGAINRLEDDFEERLQKLRSELIDIKYDAIP